MQGHENLFAKAGERLVSGVIDHFLNDVEGVFGTGIHAGTLAHRLKSL